MLFATRLYGYFYKKKSHTCEESGAQLWISFWLLLMNLKNKYVLKNCWNGPIKSRIILIFTMLHFFKKTKKHLEISLSKSRWYDLQFLWYRAKQTEFGKFRPFFCWRYHDFAHVYQKSLSSEVRSLRYGWDRHIFLSFWAILCPFVTLTTRKIKILKKWKKKTPGDTMLHKCSKNHDYMLLCS